MSPSRTQTLALPVENLDEVVRTFPAILEGLQKSYEALQARAKRMEGELCRKVEELDALHRHLAAVLEALPCGVVVRDANDKIVTANRTALELLACDLRELQLGVAAEGLRGSSADGTPYAFETRTGRRLLLASHFSPVQDAGGKFAGSVEILDDRTEQAAMTERLHAADKMAALGTMAGGIAHEIRNPLNAIKGFASLLVRRPDLDEEASRWCRLIVDASTEADSIIESMLTLGSPERLRVQTIEAQELLEQAAHMALPEGSSEAIITCRAHTSSFRGDHIKLRQAVRNLIANALRAMRDLPSESRVDIDLEQSDRGIVIRVSDAGPGVPKEMRDKIFDPFFTNHADGTGLGLALANTIVRLHGGSLRISEEPSHLGGASFLISIPQTSAESSIAPQEPLSV